MNRQNVIQRLPGALYTILSMMRINGNLYRLAEILIIILYVYLHFLPTLECCDSEVTEDVSAVLK